jgi:hypothetical protein
MASFLRHVGKQGDRKVAVVFREVPGEPHMCLVVYTELLNRNIHDPLVKCIESDIGQNSKNLADALNRMHTVDGTIILQKLHAEGMLKKVQTEQIVMTPAPNVRIKLSELNQILDEMEKGEAAVQKLAQMDSQLGIQDPVQVAKRMRGDSINNSPTVTSMSNDVLNDDAIANNLREQATRMSAEAKGLLAEAERLLEQANALTPIVTEQVAAPKRASGRPKKATVTA